jgi:chromosome partitioning protein
MHIIGVLNTKGGTGKTTITSCLAVRAAEDASVAVCDLDPQGSYSDWYRRRGSPDNPALLSGAELASDAIEGLRRTSAYDFVFLDGPPGALMVTEDAVKSSDLVVIPMRASGLDLGASQDCIQLCWDAGVPVLVVLNDKGPHDGKLVENARKLLHGWKLMVAKAAISHRVPYINAITTGATGAEKDKKAAEEIEDLWKEVMTAARKAAKARAA